MTMSAEATSLPREVEVRAGLEVEGDAALAAVPGLVGRGIPGRPGRGLDADDVGALVREQHRASGPAMYWPKSITRRDSMEVGMMARCYASSGWGW